MRGKRARAGPPVSISAANDRVKAEAGGAEASLLLCRSSSVAAGELSVETRTVLLSTRWSSPATDVIQRYFFEDEGDLGCTTWPAGSDVQDDVVSASLAIDVSPKDSCVRPRVDDGCRGGNPIACPRSVPATAFR